METNTVTTAVAAAVKVNAKAFLKELEWVARFVEAKSTIPILQNVMLVGTPEGITLTATDLETGGITTVETDASAVGFGITVPAKQALKYLKKVLDPEITLRAVGDDLMIEHDNAECSLAGLSTDSYPQLPQPETRSFELSGLLRAIPRVEIAVSKEESRFTLNGVLLDIRSEGAQMVATDGHRLSLAHVRADGIENLKVLIPKFALNELYRLGQDSAMVATDENHIWFTSGHRQIIARKLTGNFPDFERVIPSDQPFRATIDAEALKRHGERVALFADERSRAVKLTLADNRLTITAATTDSGKASGSVATTWEQPEWVTGMNWNYILDFLKLAGAPAFDLLFSKMTERDGCKWNERAVTFLSSNWKYVLMPVRI
jgi:DNA polymerase-3 subunit beta